MPPSMPPPIPPMPPRVPPMPQPIPPMPQLIPPRPPSHLHSPARERHRGSCRCRGGSGGSEAGCRTLGGSGRRHVPICRRQRPGDRSDRVRRVGGGAGAAWEWSGGGADSGSHKLGPAAARAPSGAAGKGGGVGDNDGHTAARPSDESTRTAAGSGNSQTPALRFCFLSAAHLTARAAAACISGGC